MTETQRRIKKLEDLTAEDFAARERLEAAFQDRAAEFALRQLRSMKGADPVSDAVGMIDTYAHSLQAATRAFRDGADEETVVACLLHDIFDLDAHHNHDALAAEFLRPYISPTMYWILQHHGTFQQFYMRADPSGNPDAREAFRNHPNFEATVQFCERWDQISFDPDYDSLPLSFFEPMVRRVLTRA